MSIASNQKAVLAVNQVSVTNAATAAGTIDRLEYDYATIDVVLTTSNAVTNNPSVLTLSHGTTTDATNHTNITAFVGDTAFTIPNCITSATSITGPFAKFNVDCRGLERYLRVAVSPVTTQSVTVLANLSRGSELPYTTAKSGASVVVNG